jgi:ribosomal protein S18 acetylase RimI-like enzyme
MIKITRASAKDLDSCIKIGKTRELSYLHKCTGKEAKGYLKEFLKKGIFLAAKKDDETIGFILAEFVVGKFVWIDAIVVKKEYRNSGIGKMLFKEMENICKAKGFVDLFLIAPKFNKNTAGFYRSLEMKKGNECVEFHKKLQ